MDNNLIDKLIMSKSTDETPAGATHFMDGQFYKLGRFGKVFRHNGFEWIASSKARSEMLILPKFTGHQD